MATIYGGVAPAPALPRISLLGEGDFPKSKRISLILFFNAGRDDDLSMADMVMKLGAEEESLDILGVHCPRFPSEKDPRRIVPILEGLGVNFPVFDDSDKKIRKSYLINNWPAVVIVDPMGFLAWAMEGLFPVQALRPALGTIIKTAKSLGALDKKEPFSLETSSLAFLPKRIRVKGDSMTILDLKKNRLLFARLDVPSQIAKVVRSLDLGDKLESSVTGFSLEGEKVYVSDRRKKCVRVLDMRGKEIESFKGEVHSQKLLAPPSFGRPKDSVFSGGLFYIASDSHQIWVQSLTGGGARPFAGTGAIGMDDGPVGVGTMGCPEAMMEERGVIFFTDSYSNSVRWVDSGTGEIGTIAGEGPSLYGHRDGKNSKALFQRPMGICLAGQVLYVADCYNDRIRALDLSKASTSTFYGGDKKQSLFSPMDVDFSGGRFYIADFGNGRIVSTDRNKSDFKVLEIRGL